MWKEVLKNQMSVAGLNMRSMDLDNIIDEEDDTCEKRVLAFIEMVEQLPPRPYQRDMKDGQAYSTTDMGIGEVNLSEEAWCWILGKLKNVATDGNPLKTHGFKEKIHRHSDRSGNVEYMENRYTYSAIRKTIYIYIFDDANDTNIAFGVSANDIETVKKVFGGI